MFQTFCPHTLIFRLVIAILFLFFDNNIFAQFNIDTLVSKKNKPYFCYLNSENDAYPRMITDRYFTNGFTLGIGAPDTAISRFWAKISNNIFPAIKNSDNYTSLIINLSMFTPSRFYDTIPLNDRPYAGIASLGVSRISRKPQKGIGLVAHYSIGVLGSNSGQGWIQKNWHSTAKKTPVKGWDYQIANDILLNINFLGEKRIYNPIKYIDILALAEANIGTLNNYLGIGSLMRLGWFDDYFSRPTFANGSSRRQLFTILKAQIRYVAQNSLLQGGVFNRSSPQTIPTQDLNRLYFQLEMGYVLSWKRYSVIYTQTIRTPEFKNAFNMMWGNIGGIYTF